MRERIFWIVLAVIGTSGGFYAGRLNGVKVGQTQVQQTANRFFAERGAAGGGTGQGAGGQRGFGGGQNVIGTVDKIDGTTLSVKAIDGTTTTIQVNTDATIRKEATGQLSDVHIGDRVVANGTRNGDTFQATMLQLGGRFPGGQPAGQ